jgi:chromosomal replication initiation ATPase DnaA
MVGALTTDDGKQRPASSKSIDGLASFALKHFKFPADSFKYSNSSRERAFVNVKHMVRFYMKENYQDSLVRIGKTTCKADHSTVVHSVRTHKDLYQTDFDYRQDYNEFEKAARDLGYFTKTRHAE